MRRIPSLKTIQEGLGRTFDHEGGDFDRANALRLSLVAWRNGEMSSNTLMDGANELLGGHGIESIESENGRAHMSYVNMGDTYTATVILDTSKDSVFITDYGTWVETEERKGNKFR